MSRVLEHVAGHLEHLDMPEAAAVVRDWHHDDIGYVAWGGGFASRPATWDLGLSTKPLDGPAFGFRRAVFDIAYGHVNGFPPSAILYYVLTRSFSPRFLRWNVAREARKRGDTDD